VVFPVSQLRVHVKRPAQVIQLAGYDLGLTY
jgi:hypothetical protein